MNAPEKKPGYRYIGSRIVRPDGLDKVTGRAKYGADISVSGMIHGHMVRSPHAHARIKAIDFSAALALEGVYATLSAEDFPDLPKATVSGGEVPLDMQDLARVTMARHKVLYHGQAVAAVAAATPALAARAAALVKVEYEVLPHVLDMDTAARDDAPLLHDDQFTKGVTPAPQEPSNVVWQTELKRGDIDEGFAAADLVVERTFTVPMAHQAYIEPHACLAQVDEEGSVAIWATTQGPFMVRAFTAKIAGIELGKIKVTPTEIGGGFGGKTVVYLEPVATLLAKKSGRPVKMVMSREEVFRATGPGAPARSRVKIGVRKDGTITAMEGDILMDAGSFKGAPLQPAVMSAFACYRCEHVYCRGREVVTNKPKVVAYRAPGAPQVNLATECVLNEIAEGLDIDPIELRLRNAVGEGDPSVFGVKFRAIGLQEALRAARDHPNYRAALAANQGRGVAAGYWFNGGMQSSATIHVAKDGRVTVLVGTPDIGGSRASMALMAAEALGVPVEHVRPVVTDTDSVGFNDVTGGSRVTLATGWAVIRAAEALIEDLRTRAAKLWDIPVEQVSWHDGQAIAEQSDQVLSLAQLAARAGATGGPLSATGALNAKGVAPAFAVNLCDAEVDPETGRSTIVRYTCIQDAGKAIHPAYVEGQMQGGAVQGIGWALNEAYLYNDDGVLENAGFLDYRIPVASDLPMLDTVIIEVPNPEHPYGVRGVGEVPICPPMPAVVTAVNRAAGTRITDLPLSPPRVLAAIMER